MALTMLTTLREWPWAVSMTMTSTPASTRAAARSMDSGPVPTAAPTISRPLASLAELGYWRVFSISLIVISPLRLKSASTRGSFSMRWCAIKLLASSRVVPTAATTRLSFVITASTGTLMSSMNRMSLFVSRPISLVPSTIGTPDIRYLLIKASASSTVWPGDRKIGFVITPCSERFTVSTSEAWSAIDMFL